MLTCDEEVTPFSPISSDRVAKATPSARSSLDAFSQKAIELEYRCAEDNMPRSVLDVKASMLNDYVLYIGNRHTSRIALSDCFSRDENSFDWMGEAIALNKKPHLFDTRVIEYPSGGVLASDQAPACHASIQ